MLSHVDSANRPTMVDVGDKAVTSRTAAARAVVVFPPDVVVRSGEVLRTKKGPVFDTAIIAGVMAAKRTHELIPFCHPIPLEDCKIAIEWGEGNEIVIECSVRATHKTGVEMEALTGASVRRADDLRHVQGVDARHSRFARSRLLAKAGGKRDYRRARRERRRDDRRDGSLFRGFSRACRARHRALPTQRERPRSSMTRSRSATALPTRSRAAKLRSTRSSPIGTRPYAPATKFCFSLPSQAASSVAPPSFTITSAVIDPAAEALARAQRSGRLRVFRRLGPRSQRRRRRQALEYEAHRSIAESEGEKIIAEARERFAITAAQCEHRVGKLAIGDCAVWVGVTAPHRGAAFDACRYVIDETKARVPIWKKEHYRDGQSGWVNCATRL